MPSLKDSLRAACVALSLAATGATALAQDSFPTKDVAKLDDLPGIKRYTGALLLFRQDIKYDEVAFPASPLVTNDKGVQAPKSVKRAGQRSALMYTTPAQRSPLEVLRNYQSELKASGFTPVYECQTTQCGDDSTYGISRGSAFWQALFNAPGELPFAVRGTLAQCLGGGQEITGLRYALLDNPSSGETVSVMTWQPVVKGYALPCADEFDRHTSVLVFRVQTKGMEQQMSTVSASEMNQSLTATGKVAIYGILFDSGKALIKPESAASLAEIGKLMKDSPNLKLHVVGHTDNQGGLDANLALSRLRATAVRDALMQQHSVAATRLTANGVSSLAPVSTNETEAGRAKNRRVELVLF